MLSSLLTALVVLNAQEPTQPKAAPSPGDALYAPVATADRPASLRQKWLDYVVVTSGPRAFMSPVFPAAIRMINPKPNYPREWRLGAGAFARNYANGLAARSATETGRFLTAALLKEDFRYRPSSSKNPLGRVAHAIGFTFIDKSDTGHNRLAISNFVAAGAGGFVGNLYLPRGFNDLSHAQTRMAIEFGSLAGQNILREFAPDLLKLARKLHLPFPRVPLPEWWVALDR